MNVTQGDVSIAVTGTAWMGGGVGSVQSSIEEMLGKAGKEVQIAIYEMTDYQGFLPLLRPCLGRGVHITMIINRYASHSSSLRTALQELRMRFPHFDLFDFCPERKSEDLHAKVIVVDRGAALVGSANMTWKGLVGNHELAVIVSGEVASKVGMLLDKLCEDPRTSLVEKK